MDLHWDIIARFADQPMPAGFYDDWVKAADEEAARKAEEEKKKAEGEAARKAEEEKKAAEEQAKQ